MLHLILFSDPKERDQNEFGLKKKRTTYMVQISLPPVPTNYYTVSTKISSETNMKRLHTENKIR